MRDSAQGSHPRLPDPSTFLSGGHGTVSGRRRTVARRLADRALDVSLLPLGPVLDRLASRVPQREVLVTGLYTADSELIAPAVAEMRRSRHRVRFALGAREAVIDAVRAETAAEGVEGRKFEGVNRLMKGMAPADWTIVIDDDVVLPHRFLDRLLGVAEHFGFALLQPAQGLASHAAWPVARRRAASIARETHFVEIGPVTVFARMAADELLPFPPMRYGWGLDLHWGAVAEERGWRIGVVDAVPLRHEARPVGVAYGTGDAIAEAQRFLAGRPYVDARRALETVAVHRRP